MKNRRCVPVRYTKDALPAKLHERVQCQDLSAIDSEESSESDGSDSGDDDCV